MSGSALMLPCCPHKFTFITWVLCDDNTFWSPPMDYNGSLLVTLYLCLTGIRPIHAGRYQPGIKQCQKQKQQQRTLSPLSLLPIDLLGQVFQWIPATGIEGARKDPSRLSVRAACRWLRDAFDSCNTHLVLVGAAAAEESKGSSQRRSYHALLQRLIARTSSLTSLRIKGWETGRELFKLHVPWGRLKKLDLSALPDENRYPATGGLRLQAFRSLAHCSALEELVVFSGCLFMSKPDTLPFRSTLRSLRLLYPSNSNLGRIAPLFTALQRLDTLEFDGTLDGALDLASVATCTGLRQLCLWLDAFDNVNDNMFSFTSLTQLTSLQLYESSDLSSVQPIALLSSLRHLELGDTYSITDLSPLGTLRALERLIMPSGSFVGSEACLSSCTSLRHLDLCDCHGNDGAAFNLPAISACTLLVYLDLSQSPVAGSLELLLPCTRLQRLFLMGCRQVTALAPLASLVELRVSGCEDLHSLSPLTACVSLSTLYVCHCRRVNSLAPLAACVQLKVLQLFGFKRFISLEPIAACTQLAWLNLNECNGIRSLAPLSACRALEMLQLRQCNNLASLEPLVACTALRRLDLSNLATPMDLAPLASCPSLQQLDLYGCWSVDLAPLRSCSRLVQLFLTVPLYLGAFHTFSHLKSLSIINNMNPDLII